MVDFNPIFGDQTVREEYKQRQVMNDGDGAANGQAVQDNLAAQQNANPRLQFDLPGTGGKENQGGGQKLQLAQADGQTRGGATPVGGAEQGQAGEASYEKRPDLGSLKGFIDMSKGRFGEPKQGPQVASYNNLPPDKLYLPGKEDVALSPIEGQGFKASLAEVDGKKGLLLEFPNRDENGKLRDEKEVAFIENPQDRDIGIHDRSQEGYGRGISGKELLEAIQKKGGAITEADIKKSGADPKELLENGKLEFLIGTQYQGASTVYNGVLTGKDGSKHEFFYRQNSFFAPQANNEALFMRPYLGANVSTSTGKIKEELFHKVGNSIPGGLVEQIRTHPDFRNNSATTRYSVMFQGRF